MSRLRCGERFSLPANPPSSLPPSLPQGKVHLSLSVVEKLGVNGDLTKAQHVLVVRYAEGITDNYVCLLFLLMFLFT